LATHIGLLLEQPQHSTGSWEAPQWRKGKGEGHGMMNADFASNSCQTKLINFQLLPYFITAQQPVGWYLFYRLTECQRFGGVA